MWEIIRAGGGFMWPIIFCSIAAVAIIIGAPLDPAEQPGHPAVTCTQKGLELDRRPTS